MALHRICTSLAAAAVLGLAGSPALAAYPDRPISLIVPFPPGGVADTIARPVAQALGEQLGQAVVIENRGGAGGAVGIGQAARAQPDGYTLLMSLSSISILPAADLVLERKPSYQLDQFVPIARITADPTVLVVRAESPWNSVDEFLAAARQEPGKLSYGSSGIYGTMHVPVEMLKGEAKVDMMHVPFTGGGPALQALMGGQVDAIAAGPSVVLPLIQSGRLKALAHWGEEPLESLPDVPSLKSLGQEVTFVQWSGLFALAGTPQPVIDRLREAVRVIVNDDKLKTSIARTGSPLMYLDAPEFGEYWKRDSDSMVTAVQRIGKVE